jgi:hypothetical protein
MEENFIGSPSPQRTVVLEKKKSVLDSSGPLAFRTQSREAGKQILSLVYLKKELFSHP